MSRDRLPDRMPAIPADRLTPEQAQAAADFKQQRGVELFGPFVALLRSPQVLSRAAPLGEYLRYFSALPLKLSEFVILITARHWTQPVEWYIHHPIALKAGLSPAICDAVAEGRRPEGMAEDEAVIYDFSIELHVNKAVSDATYARALALFGEQAVLDLIAGNAYYTFLAMTMNAARTALPDGIEPAITPLV